MWRCCLIHLKKLCEASHNFFRKLKPFYASLNDECSFSIYQLLRSFEDSEFIVTDSFHGVVFALIFKKPFKYIRNTFCGNARFDSLFQMLGIDNVENVNWEIINRSINEQKCRQLSFLESSLEQKIYEWIMSFHY